MITVIDYDAGNLRSVVQMLSYLGHESRIAENCRDLQGASKIILPGVGHFDFGMRNLEQRGFVEALRTLVLGAGTPLLGICLGAQMLTRRSDEGSLAGLGFIAGDTVAFDRSRLSPSDRIPHMGWADTRFRPNSRLFSSVKETPRFYYVHSFHLQCDDSSDELCTATHGYGFTSGVERGNVLGVQFHPEKSHRFGMQVLKNFAELY